MAHTEGPWDVDDDTLEIFSITPGHSTGWIAKVLGNDDNGRRLPPDEMAANARLIACAPALLEALIAMRYAFTSDGTDGQHKACRMADEALANATRSDT
jgi:hypothetical protein